jgi:hypothetical protein
VIRWFVVALVVIAAGVVATQWSMADVAEPDYAVVRADGPFEVRRYQPMIVASVEVTGTRRSAVNAGFRALADYIFGANVPNDVAAGGTPVIQEGGRDGAKIDMTAPVLQRPLDGERWTVSFVMPESFTMETLPRPKSDGIAIEERPEETVAVLTFSGLPTERRLEAKTAALRMWLSNANVADAVGPPRYAFYDPPWTLPFLRRNEVMLPVD